jgi:phospholipid transport system substrate-binding protein
VIERLAREKENLAAHPEKLYDLIQELVVPHFDFPIMSRWVLGNAWNTINAGNQEQFIAQFRTMLVRTYAKALMEYSDETIKFLPMDSDPNSNLVMIKSQVISKGSGKPIPINYRMHISGGEWKVIDISVDGVSLIGTYRGSFASEIRKNGIDSLILKLTERNAKLLEGTAESESL